MYGIWFQEVSYYSMGDERGMLIKIYVHGLRWWVNSKCDIKSV